MLDRIIATVERRIPEVAARLEELRTSALHSPPVRSLTAAVTAPGTGVIAEIKRRSPSRGPLAPDLDPAALAAAYEAGGAAAISVLTEPEFFAGSAADLRAAASSIGVPVLRKDFIIHPAQVWESRAIGADALLLIVAALDDETLTQLIATALEAGIEVLVEVHDEVETERAHASGAGLVGVNARDLVTFEVDLGVAERLAGRLDGFEGRVAESGITGPADVARMAAAGYDAVLVGESLVRHRDPADAVSLLTGQRVPGGGPERTARL
jgi:indole-3-glycerol phosphate synthase